MGDLLRLVELSAGGRPIEVLNLEQSDVYMKERDSFQVTPPAKRQRTLQSTRRYGGGRVIGESHENGRVGATWRVTGAGADDAIANVEELLAAVESDRQNRFIEWRPDGASQSVLYEIRGPGEWTPAYKWVEFSQNQSAGAAISWPVAPLARGLPMDIFDDFSVDSSDDYLKVGGGLYIAAGLLRPGIPDQMDYWLHTGRGYLYEDVQVTVEYLIGAGAPYGWLHGVVVKRLDENNMIRVYMEQASAQVRIDKVDGGVATTLATVGAVAGAGQHKYIRGRLEGNTIIAERFPAGGPPGPMTTPEVTVSHTLVGADATKFGVGARGLSGLAFSWQGGDHWMNDLAIEPYTYRDKVLPEKIELGGAIPGTGPALCDLHITPSGGAAAPVFALAGWQKRALAPLAGAVVPFGVIQAESADMGIGGWAVTAAGGASGGSYLNDATPTSAETYYAGYEIDPTALAPDDFSGELLIEFWGKVILDPALVTPRLALRASPRTPGVGPNRFTNEDGSAGKLLTLPTGDAGRFVKLGTIPFRLEAGSRIAHALWLLGYLGAGSAGNEWGVDYLIAVPARQRIAGPTGKANDASYPKFVANTSQHRRVLTSDLRGYISEGGSGPLFPAAALGGSQIELPPGDVDLLVKLSSLVPDDPTAFSTAEQLTHAAAVHVAVTPRFHLARAA